MSRYSAQEEDVTPAATHRRPTLLIVDDDRAIFDVVGRFGQTAGFEVVRCSSGRDAIGYLEHERTDLAIVDLRMPDVGGLDVLRAIRAPDPDGSPSSCAGCILKRPW